MSPTRSGGRPPQYRRGGKGKRLVRRPVRKVGVLSPGARSRRKGPCPLPRWECGPGVPLAKRRRPLSPEGRRRGSCLADYGFSHRQKSIGGRRGGLHFSKACFRAGSPCRNLGKPVLTLTGTVGGKISSGYGPSLVPGLRSWATAGSALRPPASQVVPTRVSRPIARTRRARLSAQSSGERLYPLAFPLGSSASGEAESARASRSSSSDKGTRRQTCSSSWGRSIRKSGAWRASSWRVL